MAKRRKDLDTATNTGQLTAATNHLNKIADELEIFTPFQNEIRQVIRTKPIQAGNFIEE